jgi:hypothetical protein
MRGKTLFSVKLTRKLCLTHPMSSLYCVAAIFRAAQISGMSVTYFCYPCEERSNNQKSGIRDICIATSVQSHASVWNGGKYTCMLPTLETLKYIWQRRLYASVIVRYHSGGSMKLNACISLVAHMVYL